MAEQPEDLYRRIIEAVGRGETASMAALVADDMVDHNPIPGQAPGRAGFEQWMSSARGAFPDLHGTVEDVVVAGDRVAARVTWRGTHQGDFLGIPPTGRRVSFTAFHLVRFAGGRAAEWWGTADELSALRQLGATVTHSDALRE